MSDKPKRQTWEEETIIKLKKALEFYANNSVLQDYCPICGDDIELDFKNAHIARTALKECFPNYPETPDSSTDPVCPTCEQGVDHCECDNRTCVQKVFDEIFGEQKPKERPGEKSMINHIFGGEE